MKQIPATVARTLTGSALALALLVVPGALQAQEARIYSPTELTSMPKPAAPAKVARLVASSYPPSLRDAGTGGSVQVQFVVGPDGQVEPESVQVIAASVPALASAAKAVAQKIEFVPGKKDGQAVRTRVVLPITYRAGE